MTNCERHMCIKRSFQLGIQLYCKTFKLINPFKEFNTAGSILGGHETEPNRGKFAGQGSSIHSKKRTTCSDLMKTALNNVLLPKLFKVVNNTEQVDEPELACNQV